MNTKIELIIVAQLVVAFILGAIIGLERERHGHSAGIRTYASVTLGAALFTLMGIHATDETAAGRIVSNIVTGIGFLGAGLIYRDQAKDFVFGLTTASSIWTSAAVGVAVAYNMYVIAVSATIAIYFLLALQHFRWYIQLTEKWAEKHKPKSHGQAHEQ